MHMYKISNWLITHYATLSNTMLKCTSEFQKWWIIINPSEIPKAGKRWLNSSSWWLYKTGCTSLWKTRIIVFFKDFSVTLFSYKPPNRDFSEVSLRKWEIAVSQIELHRLSLQERKGTALVTTWTGTQKNWQKWSIELGGFSNTGQRLWHSSAERSGHPTPQLNQENII